jgi:hypothetical protein
MLTGGELVAALAGVRQLIRFDGSGFQRFDATPAGFWKSFWAALLVLPIWAYVVSGQIVAAHPDFPLRVVAFKVVGYAISWLAYPLLMVRIVDFLGRWPRYLTYMVAYNWFQIAETLVWLPLVLLLDSGLAPHSMGNLLGLAVYGLMFAYNWFLVRRGLLVERGTAIALVIIDFLLSLVIDGITDMLT